MKTVMKFIFTVALLFVCTAICLTQQLYTKDLPSFEKIMISSYISATLIISDKNTIVINHSNVEPEKINIQVKGNTLRLYLLGNQILPGLVMVVYTKGL